MNEHPKLPQPDIKKELLDESLVAYMFHKFHKDYNHWTRKANESRRKKHTIAPFTDYYKDVEREEEFYIKMSNYALELIVAMNAHKCMLHFPELYDFHKNWIFEAHSMKS